MTRAVVAFSFLLAAMLVPAQIRGPRKIDPQAQLIRYYHEFPDRYIRVSKESWQYSQPTKTAVHAFTLNNTATVPYCEIEVRFTYQDDKGATVATVKQSIPGILQPYRPAGQKDLRVKPVPDKAVNAVVSVSKALVCR